MIRIRVSNEDRCLRKHQKKNNDCIRKESISKFFFSDSGVPTTLMELSNNELKSINDSSIHLGGIFYSEKLVSYKSFTIGSNISWTSIVKEIDGKSIRLRNINLSKMKNRAIAITTKTPEIRKLRPKTIICTARQRRNKKNKLDRDEMGSGIVLLFLAILPQVVSKHNPPIQPDLFNILQETKSNIMKRGGANHCNSTGYYYSFGNKGSYERVGNCSVGQYASKKSTSVEKTKRIGDNAVMLEKLCASHIKESVLAMENLLPNLSTLISPVVDTAFDMQVKHGPVGLKKVHNTNSGMWQSCMCVNARTSIMHTEDDCTYTFAKVPSQISSDVKNKDYQRMFLVQINKKELIALPLYMNLSFIFTGTFLSHRQQCTSESSTDGSRFYNIVSYGNKRLFFHIRKSFKRNLDESNLSE